MNAMRVGVISTFHNNYNYGGKLQAYAMIRVIKQAGYEAQQIRYGQHQKPLTPAGRVKRLLSSSDYRAAVFQTLLKKLLKSESPALAQRKAAFDAFDAWIDHTEEVYDDAALLENCRQFDAYLCGSDQIWNPDLLKLGYFLNFVPEDRGKISYAASVSNRIDEASAAVFFQHLRSFDGISVREEDTARTLSELLQRPVETVADPTLLLDRQDWDRVASEPLCQEKYLFCYFLGYDRKMRRSAEKFAKEHGLRIVTLPHLLGIQGRCYGCDLDFGDQRLYDVSPAQFLALIRDADFVMTDSFHATVLSLVYRKQFAVYGRTGHAAMGNRLDHLLGLFDLQDRKCQAGTVPEAPIAYRQTYEKVERLRQSSLEFLKRQLSNAEAKYEKQSD